MTMAEPLIDNGGGLVITLRVVTGTSAAATASVGVLSGAQDQAAPDTGPGGVE